jgi:hypothetical protein
VREAVDLFKIPNDTVRIGSCADLIKAATASLKFNRSLLHNQATSFTHKFESLHAPTTSVVFDSTSAKQRCERNIKTAIKNFQIPIHEPFFILEKFKT